MKMKRKDWMLLTAVLLVSIVFFFYLFFSRYQNSKRTAMMETELYVEGYSYQLDYLLNAAVEPSKSLSLLLQRNKEDAIKDFDEICASMVDMTITKAVQLVPDGIVTKCYPLAGNEAAIGRNDFEDVEIAPYAELAKEEGTPVLSPPMELKQGGKGMLYLYPVFCADMSDKNSFYGFVVTVIDMRKLYAAMQLEILEKADLKFSLCYLPEQGGLEIPLWEHKADDIKLPQGVEFGSSGNRWRFMMDASQQMLQKGYIFWEITATFLVTFFAGLLLKLKRQKDALDVLANTDPLTGLMNRRCFENMLLKKKQQGEAFGFFYMDLDKFKHVNDTYGHDAGDFILKTMAERFRENLGKNCQIARVGGDEFVAVIDKEEGKPLHREELCERAVELQKAVSRECQYQDITLFCRVSVGISIFPVDGDNLKELLKKADESMYRDKQETVRRDIASVFYFSYMRKALRKIKYGNFFATLSAYFDTI